MAQLLIAAGAGTMAAGQIQKGRAAEREGSTAYKIGLYNRDVQEREARAIEQKTRFESLRQAKEARRIRGKLRTKIAASGAEMGTGAAFDLEEEQLAELELENLLIGYEGGQRAARVRRQGEMDVVAGIMAKKRGKAAQKASYIEAGSTILTGFGMAGSFGGGGGDLGLARKHGLAYKGIRFR